MCSDGCPCRQENIRTAAPFYEVRFLRVSLMPSLVGQRLGYHSPRRLRRDFHGVLPNAREAARAKLDLANRTLTSANALVQGLLRKRLLGRREARAAFRSCFLDIQASPTPGFALPDPSVPGAMVEHKFYEWYYNALDLLEQRDFASLRSHVQRLPFVTVLPLGDLRRAVAAVRAP